MIAQVKIYGESTFPPGCRETSSMYTSVEEAEQKALGQ